MARKSKNRAAPRLLLILCTWWTGCVPGCAPTFVGEATTTTNECVRWCAQQNMRIAGMVRHGTYSTSCVCEVPRGASSSAAPRAGSVGGVLAAVLR